MDKMKHSDPKIGSEKLSTRDANQLLKVHAINRMKMNQSNTRLEKVRNL